MSARLGEFRWAMVGGVLAAIGLFAGVAAVGRIGSFEALGLLESILPTVRFLASTIVGASVTVLALMLTVLGLTYSTEWEFRPAHFLRLRQIAGLTTLNIVVSLGLLLLIGIPLEAADHLRTYYNAIYYVVIGTGAVTAGILVATVLLLWRTIGGFVAIGHPNAESDLIESFPARQPAG